MNCSSTSNIQQKLCLATVSNKEYWPGTQKMIKSFRKVNPWFKGELLIISNEPNLGRKIEKLGARLIVPDKRLNTLLAQLNKDLPSYSKISERLLWFEIFRHDSYNKVIYADSDVVFLKELKLDNFHTPGIYAAPDPSFYRGFVRKKDTCEKIPASYSNKKNCYSRFFNTGFVVIDQSLLCREYYLELLRQINAGFFRKIADVIADEPVFNHTFEKHILEISPKYNTPVHLLVKKLLPPEPFILHFTGKYKPWRIKSWIVLLFRNFRYMKFLLLWYRI